MNEYLSLWNSSTLAEQFQAGAVLLICVFVIALGVLVCGPAIVSGARDLFPDETLEDDEQRLVQARGRRRASEVPHQVDAGDQRLLLEAIAHMPHQTNRIH